MKERGMMPRFYKFIQSSLVEKIFLGILSLVYLVYMVGFVHVLYAPSSPSPIIVEHQVDANPVAELQHWSVENMRAAIDDGQEVSDTFDFTGQGSSDIAKGKAAQQDGQVPSDTSLSYPLSTVGKVFFTNGGQDYVCSGTAIVSSNHNTIDTAGHCLYGHGNWVQNLIFCPLYDNGKTPYGCWVARALEVPADWIRGELSALHRDFGMAIVSTGSQGDLTDVVGGAGWAYNQSARQPFYAYGYPAGYPFDGQTRRSCEGSSGKAWPHGGGTVVSIPCDMTGGSSGGPWFIKVNGSWYLNGHNDFTSNLQRGHMFSPYYDDVWYALYNKAQRS